MIGIRKRSPAAVVCVFIFVLLVGVCCGEGVSVNVTLRRTVEN